MNSLHSRSFQAITARLNVPLAQTSANVSGSASPTCVADFEHLIPKIDLVIDGGRIGHGSEGWCHVS